MAGSDHQESIAMEAFKREVELRFDQNNDKLDAMVDSISTMASSVSQLVERDIRSQEKEDRQLEHNQRVDARFVKLEERQDEIYNKLGIGLFKLGILWSVGGVFTTGVLVLAIAYLKTQGIDLKP